MERRALVVAMASLVLLASYPRSSQADAGPRFATAAAQLDAWLPTQVGPQRIPGLVAMVVDAHGTLYLGAAGQQDVAHSRPMRTDAIFRIASMTKPITSAAAMMLVEEGRLGLDDPVSKYLPEFADRPVMASFDFATGRYTTRPPRQPMTIRHLLTHTSGLGYPFANPVLARLAQGSITAPPDYPLLHDPGARWTYGESTRVLGRVIEKITGEPLDAVLRTRIFQPLGMRETSYSTPAADAARVATVHRQVAGRLQEQPNPEGEIGSPVQGDGGLNSTAEDYAKFIRFILAKGVTPDGRRLLKAATIEQMSRSQTGRVRVERQPAPLKGMSEPFPVGAGRDGFGLGFQVTGRPAEAGLRRPGSLSWAGIYNTEFWIDPSAGIGAILLMQYLPFYDAAAIETLEGFERRVYAGLR